MSIDEWDQRFAELISENKARVLDEDDIYAIREMRDCLGFTPEEAFDVLKEVEEVE